MARYEYDLIVIGAGSGGVRAARMSSSYGARVAIAEEKYLGGTCVNVGCVPKKLFVYASHFSEDFVQSKAFGWAFSDTKFDWPTLLENKNTEIARLNKIYQDLLDEAGVDRFEGRAKIIDGHSVKIGSRILSTQKILIATGGKPVRPEFPGAAYTITSDDAFYLESLPARCLVVGGGYIAVEFAGIFNGLGIETELSYRGDLFLRDFDIDIRSTVSDELSKKGIKLRFQSEIESVKKSSDDELVVRLKGGEVLNTDMVLCAIGRVPAVEGLGLENVALDQTDNGGIVIDDNFGTKEKSIFALGDVTDRLQLTPVAIEEAMCFSSTQFGGKPRKMCYEHVPTAIFCQPNAATVGLTESEARDLYPEVDIYRSVFRPMKHTISGSDEKFMMKLIVNRIDDKVLGVHMVGSEAGEIIQGIAIALKLGVTKSVFDETVGIHPTTAEEFVTMREVIAN
ncbi:MAG: glutathione-disulfide reductase [Gammaproteobacteria bacterium]|nr:glutathione-disulfide reductase [Gammaproteobacteria bacterium]